MPVARHHRVFTYDAWANRETHRALAAAPPSAVTLGRFAHVLAAQILWFGRIQGRPAQVPVWPEWTVAECGERTEQLARLWPAYFDAVTEDELAREITYTNSQGQTFTSTVDDILTHVALHSAYHRGQVAAELRAAGAVPATTDFIHAVRLGLL